MGEGLALAVILTFSQQGNITNDSEYNEAIKMASLAGFQQSGLKSVADKEVKTYEKWAKAQVSREVEMGVGYLFWAFKVAQDGKIVYSWSF